MLVQRPPRALTSLVLVLIVRCKGAWQDHVVAGVVASGVRRTLPKFELSRSNCLWCLHLRVNVKFLRILSWTDSALRSRNTRTECEHLVVALIRWEDVCMKLLGALFFRAVNWWHAAMQIHVALHANALLNIVLAAKTIAFVSWFQQSKHLTMIVAIVMAHASLGFEALPTVQGSVVFRVLWHRNQRSS